ncbi:hypothetical protein JR347_06780 [Fulvivirga lutea]|uniref:Uncharacterized protein n=1 Tax=Fulvivirga lutea TaxID=2810512 RepID=A0A974WKE2_9BACT|nr:hypothetical protein [Fulvivirga lutea]QSE98777.1 hypothetical protein JR347_06780 [Fulvivirga lutea]
MTTHYCGGHAVESKLIYGHEKLDCGMPNMDEEHHEDEHSATHYSKAKCCDNKFQYLDTEDSFKSKVQHFINELAPAVPQFLVIPNYIALDVKTPISGDAPPLVDKDILTLHQVFRL